MPTTQIGSITHEVICRGVRQKSAQAIAGHQDSGY
jgi:hypothetical protein